MSEGIPRVVIIGGGFGGLYAATALGRAPVGVTLIDRRNHHVFQPLLYQVATAGLSAIDIAEPIRRILRRQRNTTVLMAEAERVDLENRQVLLTGGQGITYDHLIVATGVTDSYFGHEEWRPYAPGLKSIEDALEIRRRILLAFERAEMEQDPDRRRAWLTFVVIGGGPTGAELAGALSEIARLTLVGDFRRFDPSEARILLVEGASRVLPGYPEDLSEKALRQLQRLGVEVHRDTLVTDIGEGGVTIGEERIRAGTVLWAAGIAAPPLSRSLGVPLDRVGRVLVEPDLSLPGHPEAFVIGDLAALEIDGRPVPGVAPAAIQQGRHASRNIIRSLRDKATLPFRYRDRGSMATLGRKAAVAVLGRLHLSGLVAWLAWLFVHILFLIGFRNRFVVLFEWAKSYLTYSRSARLILQETSSSRPAAKPQPPGPETGSKAS
jgi:NADH dehydrogenase